MNDTEYDDKSLADALARHKIDLPPDQADLLDAYCQLLWGWNRKLNLTRHTDYEKFVTRDLMDVQHLEPLIPPGDRVLDVGTGGGVPGIPLAVMRGDLAISVCDSVAKKAKVVADIVTQMDLNVPVFSANVQDVLSMEQFGTLVVRAVAPIPKLLGWLKPHWDAFNRLLIIKGPAWVEERGEARHRGLLGDMNLRRVDAYHTPGRDAESVILHVWPKD